MNYICHSGGCPGSDMVWENESAKYGIKTVAYSFASHIQQSKNQKILSENELKEGFESAMVAEKSLKRNLNSLIYPYMKNLISRNWFQVKNSESLYGIGTFNNDAHTIVNGGTGWTIQMAIDSKKDVFFFDQELKYWNKYNYNDLVFEKINYIPKLTENFGGVGTRNVNLWGEMAIKNILKYNFNR